MQLSLDELNVLSTALAQLVSSNLTRVKHGRYRFLCSDGRKRAFSEDELLSLMDRLAGEAGVGPVAGEALSVAKEAGLR